MNIHGFVADGGTFSERMAELPELKKLGVSVIYLPPLSGPEAYLNNHPAELAPGYGSESELRAYVGAAHRLGMLVIADMIAHHLFTLSGIWREHPEFLRHDEHGNPLSYSIGSMLTATQHPGYRRFYLDCCRSLIERFDLDGFRFDVAGFQLPDWNEDKEGGVDVLLKDAAPLHADMVVLAIGVSPDSRLAAEAGLGFKTCRLTRFCKDFA